MSGNKCSLLESKQKQQKDPEPSEGVGNAFSSGL